MLYSNGGPENEGLEMRL